MNLFKINKMLRDKELIKRLNAIETGIICVPNDIECVEVAKIIRCKDCKYLKELHYEEEGEKPYIKYRCGFFKDKYQRYLEDFCSYAERR